VPCLPLCALIGVRYVECKASSQLARVNSGSDKRQHTTCQCILPLCSGLWLKLQDCSIWLVGRFAPLASSVRHEWHSGHALEYQLLERRGSHAVEIELHLWLQCSFSGGMLGKLISPTKLTVSRALFLLASASLPFSFLISMQHIGLPARSFRQVWC
jgi:hypothetical protein